MQESFLKKLQKYGIFSQKEYHSQAFSRNIGLFSIEEQERLAKAKIAIPGMGGVGGIHFMTMVRTGIGKFNISDFDIYEPVNINRQFGARVPDFGRSKMEVMKKQALSVNPFIEINEFPTGISQGNIDEFLDGVDVVIDSLDFFAFDARRLLFNRAREKGVYVITAGPLGFSAAMLIFAPDKGMGFDEYFNIIKGMKPEDKYLAFALGLAPKATQFKYMDTSKLSFKSKKGPSLNIACQLCSGMAGTETVRILLKRGGIKPVPYYFQFDAYSQKYCRGKLFMGNRNPIQIAKSKLVKSMLNKRSSISVEEPELPSSIFQKDKELSAEAIAYLTRAGIQAPSGDNAQPWKFSNSPNAITLYLDEDADRSFFNVDQLASVISCGAVIENIKIAASALGLGTKIEYHARESCADNIATLTFSEEPGLEKDLLAEAIWTRKTNRKLYKKESVPSGFLRELTNTIKGIPGTDICFITERKQLEILARLVSQADRIRTERRDLHEHLAKMIRYSMDEATEKRDGFYIKNLEAGLDGELFLKATKSWSVMNIANKLGFGKIVAQAAYKGIINSAGVALVITNGKTRQDFLYGGQALERVWLGLARAGFQFQPMTAITLFFLRRQLEGDDPFSDSHAQMLEKIRGEYQALFTGVDLEKNGQVMLFRFGKADGIDYGTFRKTMESLKA